MADSLKRTMRARVLLIRNGANLYDQEYYEPNIQYTEGGHQRVVLSTNMATPVEVSMHGVDEAASLFVQTDRDILVALDTPTKTWPVSEHGALMLVGNFTHLYLQNESTTNQATVDLVVTD